MKGERTACTGRGISKGRTPSSVSPNSVARGHPIGGGSPCWPEESKETGGSEVRALREFHEFGFAEPRIVAEESKGDSVPFGTRLSVKV